MNLRTMTKAKTRNMTVCVFSASTDQIVIWPNSKQFSEVTKGNRSVGLKAKVTVVMGGCQVTAFTENTQDRARDRKLIKLHEIKHFKSLCLFSYNFCYQPGEEDTFNHHEVLHENIPLCLLA